MKAVFLDKGSLDWGDVSFDPLTALPVQWQMYDQCAPEVLPDRLKEAQIVLTNKVRFNKATFDCAPDLSLICVAATGYDHIDLDMAKARKVRVCNVAHYSTNAVTQHTLALILNALTRMPDYISEVRSGRWGLAQGYCLKGPTITELSGMTVGVIGYGAIGQKVAEVLKTFGAKILIAKRDQNDQREHRVPLEILLATSDIVTLHCPDNEQTHHIINKKTLALMRPESILINASRGGLVDDVALLEALECKALGFAALDVLSQEPPPIDFPLLSKHRPNLYVTPHTAWASQTARQGLIDQLAQNIHAYLSGKEYQVVA